MNSNPFLLNDLEIQFLKKSKRIKFQNRFALIGSVALVISSLSGGIYYLNDLNKDLTIAQKNEAEAKIEAQDSARVAQLQRQIAIEEAKRASDSARVAYEQRQRANDSALVAKDQRQKAIEEAKRASDSARVAYEQRQRANDSALVAKDQRQKAIKEANKNDRLRRLEIAQNLSTTSIETNNARLKGLLARAAFLFQIDNKGDPFDPLIYRSIVKALEKFEKSYPYKINKHNGWIDALICDKNYIYSFGKSDKSHFKWKILSFPTNFNYLKDEPESNIVLKSPNRKWKVKKENSKLFIVEEIRASKTIELVRYQAQGLALGFLQNQDQLIYAAGNEIIKLDLNSGKSQLFLKTPYRINSLAVNPKGSLLAIGHKNTIEIYRISQTPIKVIDLTGHTGSFMFSIAFSPNGEYLASGNSDGIVKVWSVNNWQKSPISIDSHDNWITAVNFSSDSKYVFSGTKAGTIYRWPVHINPLASILCKYLDTDLSNSEWNSYIAPDIPKYPLCKQKVFLNR